MPEVAIYNKEGKEAGSTELAESVFGLPWNANLVHQVVSSLQANRRRGTAHTKGRGEVAGGGRKPWRQKGTGRARHGSIRSPIWVGGGVAHGPRSEKDYFKKINKKTRRKALLVALSQKLRDKEIVMLDSLTPLEPKTKRGAAILKNLSLVPGFAKLGQGASAIVLTPTGDKNAVRAFRNIERIRVEEARNLNALDALSAKYLILPKESAAILEKSSG